MPVYRAAVLAGTGDRQQPAAGRRPLVHRRAMDPSAPGLSIGWTSDDFRAWGTYSNDWGRSYVDVLRNQRQTVIGRAEWKPFGDWTDLYDFNAYPETIVPGMLLGVGGAFGWGATDIGGPNEADGDATRLTADVSSQSPDLVAWPPSAGSRGCRAPTFRRRRETGGGRTGRLVPRPDGRGLRLGRMGDAAPRGRRGSPGAHRRCELDAEIESDDQGLGRVHAGLGRCPLLGDRRDGIRHGRDAPVHRPGSFSCPSEPRLVRGRSSGTRSGCREGRR